MSLPDVLEWIAHAVRVELFHIAGTPITLVSLLTALVLVVGAARLSRVMQRTIERALDARQLDDPGTRALLTRLSHYGLMAVAIALAMQTLGFDLGSLFAAGAIFAVGIGFAMQTIAQNFVSGVILLLERSIRPGDILRVGGRIVRVEHMGIRSTVVRTLDDEDLIVPNSSLVQDTVSNLTFNERRIRVRVLVGVHYDSDMALVEQVLSRVGQSFPHRIPAQPAVAQLRDFGASSVDWELSVWVADPWSLDRAAADLRMRIWNAFKDDGVVIAYPQVDVHLVDGTPLQLTRTG